MFLNKLIKILISSFIYSHSSFSSSSSELSSMSFFMISNMSDTFLFSINGFNSFVLAGSIGFLVADLSLNAPNFISPNNISVALAGFLGTILSEGI